MPVGDPVASASLLPPILSVVSSNPALNKSRGGVGRLPSRSHATTAGSKSGRRNVIQKKVLPSNISSSSSSSRMISIGNVTLEHIGSTSNHSSSNNTNWQKKKNLKNSPYLKHLSVRNKDLYLMRVGSITDVDSLDDEDLAKEICIQNKLMEVLSPISGHPEHSISNCNSGIPSSKKGGNKKSGAIPLFIYGGSNGKQQGKSRIKISTGSTRSNSMITQHHNQGFTNSFDSMDQLTDYASSDGSHYRDSVNTAGTGGSDCGVFEDELVSINSYDEDLISDDGSRYNNNSYAGSRGISRQSLASVDEL